MFSLNPREQLFIVAILVATLVGATVKYWRDARREGVSQPHAEYAASGIQTAAGSGKP